MDCSHVNHELNQKLNRNTFAIAINTEKHWFFSFEFRVCDFSVISLKIGIIVVCMTIN